MIVIGGFVEFSQMKKLPINAKASANSSNGLLMLHTFAYSWKVMKMESLEHIAKIDVADNTEN